MLYFQRIPFSDHLEITTAVVLPCGQLWNVSLCIDIVLLFVLHFLGLWDFVVQHNWKQSIAQPRARRVGVMYVACSSISLT